MQQSFSTDNLEIFNDMIVYAVKAGLTFKSYPDSHGHFVIEYTSGF